MRHVYIYVQVTACYILYIVYLVWKMALSKWLLYLLNQTGKTGTEYWLQTVTMFPVFSMNINTIDIMNKLKLERRNIFMSFCVLLAVEAMVTFPVSFHF